MRLHTALLVTVLFVTATQAIAESPTFSISDQLGRHWQHELVEYSLNAAEVKAINGSRLTDSAGREVLYQLDAHRNRLVFQADVQPYKSNTYTFIDGAPTAKTDLAITESDSYIELSNSRTGMRIAKTLQDETSVAPILAWRLASGSWVGATRFAKAQSIKHYSTSIIERGPVRSRISCNIWFDNGDTWEIALELQAHEPAVKVTETFNCEEKRLFTFDFSEKFSAANAFVRSSSRQPFNGKKFDYGLYLNQELKDPNDNILTIEPWVHWGGVPTRTTSFSLADTHWQDVVFFSTCSPAKWVDPTIDRTYRARVGRRLTQTKDGRVTLTYELKKGQREYLIGAVPGDVDRKNLEGNYRVPTQAQAYQMKYSDYPLDRVKDYTLFWPSTDVQATGFLSEAHQKELLANFEVDPRTLNGLKRQKPTTYSLEKYLPYFLATGDEQLERMLIDLSLLQVQNCVTQLTSLEGGIITVGFAPHHYRAFVTTCNLVSTIYSSPRLTDAERNQLRAQLAFLGYLFNRDAFCSPARGFAGFPNMTACAYGVRGAIASVLPGHPMQKQWMQRAVNDLKNDFLNRWSDEDGNWIGTHTESFSYTRLTFDLVLGALYQSYRSGVDAESLFHPTIKQMGEWFAHVNTPRDARILNWRHDPPVGHVYKFDLLPSQFALFAFMWKDRDPEFAAHMKWMQLEQGNKQVQSVGGFSPSFAGYRELFMANNVTPKAPHYESRHWEESSVILRNHYDHELESMLYLIAGRGHTHYDRDSGSITLWGKGEVIADDFGYYAYAPGEDHNMLDTPVAPPAKLMSIVDFSKGPLVDYVRGEKKAWTRRIFFVKHDQPEGPNYYVTQDALTVVAPAAWRMWFESQSVTVDGARATVKGLHRVTTDIHFARLPKDAQVTSEEKTRNPSGLNSEGRYPGKNPTTQTGIIIAAPQYESMLTLLYPRLKDEKQADVTTIADGHGFKIVTDFGTDYVFLSDSPIKYSEGPLSFEGTAGFARIHGSEVSLDLKEGGKITYGKKQLTKEATKLRKRTANLIADGELKIGEYSIFPEQSEQSEFTVELQKGSPLPGKSTLNGDYCQKVVCKIKETSKWRRLLPLTTGSLFINPKQTYRVKVRIYIPGKNRVYFSSYAQNAQRQQVKNDKGQVWAWSLGINGPTEGFQDFETTIGPKGSGAEHVFPDGAITLTPLGCRIYDEGDTFYIDDMVFEPVDDDN